MRTFLNRRLDRVSRTHLRVFEHPIPAFQVCGYTGFIVGFVQSLILIKVLGLSELVQFGVTGVVILTFYGLVMATKIVTGQEQIIYYHHEIAVVAMVALFLHSTHQPVLPYLDVAILGIGLFLAFGRMGCLMVGCCHGRPSRIGPCYGPEHARAGFPESFVGVRLFPVQALESLFALNVVLMGGAALLARTPRPGEALELYTVVYGCGRFFFEFLRGDVDRPYFWGFSQAQWISLLLMSGTLWAGFRGALPFHLWHAFILAALLLIVLATAVSRRLAKEPRHLLLHPDHMQEIAVALKRTFEQQGNSPSAERVVSTSLGIQISSEQLSKSGRHVFHYALSAREPHLSHASAKTLAEFILRLRHPYASLYKLMPGRFGVSHVLVFLDPQP